MKKWISLFDLCPIRPGMRNERAARITAMSYLRDCPDKEQHMEKQLLNTSEYILLRGKDSFKGLLQMVETNPVNRINGQAITDLYNSVPKAYRKKYAGDLLLQKFFTNNHVEKKQCFNRGELPQYFVAEDHEPIIDRETFDAVQIEIARRAAMYTVAGRKVAEDAEDDMAELTPAMELNDRIHCGICGKKYRRKIARLGTPYAAPIWICGTYSYRGRAYCASKQIPEKIPVAGRKVAEDAEDDMAELTPAMELNDRIHCGICGKKYRRKIARLGTPYAAPIWICGTYSYRGRAYCASKQIPEKILIDLIIEALGNDYSPDDIDHIEMHPNNRVLFVFTDGHAEEHFWKDHSRKDSWDADKRNKAAEKTRAQHQARKESADNERSKSV